MIPTFLYHNYNVSRHRKRTSHILYHNYNVSRRRKMFPTFLYHNYKVGRRRKMLPTFLYIYIYIYIYIIIKKKLYIEKCFPAHVTIYMSHNYNVSRHRKLLPGPRYYICLIMITLVDIENCFPRSHGTRCDVQLQCTVLAHPPEQERRRSIECTHVKEPLSILRKHEKSQHAVY